MKTLKQHLQEKFEYLIPHKQLTAPEIAEIKQAVKEWLQEHQQEYYEQKLYRTYQEIEKLIEELENG